MEYKKVFVTVRGEEDEKLQLPTNDDGNVEVELLKEYFPGAIGLTYKVGNEKRAVQRVQHYFKAPCESGWDAFEYSIFFGNNFKRREPQNVDQIKDLMAAIREQKQGISSNKTFKIASKKSTSKNGRPMKLHVGWLHKGGERYTQIKRPRGGIRVLEVTETDDITVPLLINLIKRVFFHNASAPNPGYSEDDLNFNIGNYNGSIIKQFENGEGNTCGLFEYLKCHGLVPSKCNFYLLTELKAKETNKTDLALESKSKLGIEDKLETASSPTQPCLMQGLKKFDVQYLKWSKSIYTEAPAVNIFYDEMSCIDMITSKQPEIQWSSEHNVLHFNFEICNISHEEQCFLNVTYNVETNEFEHEFPSSRRPVIPHTILHDVEELVGVYENKIGLCVIPSCTNECKPIFKWYLDGTLLYQQSMMYFINISKNGEYLCEIMCSFGKMRATPILVDLFESTYRPKRLCYGGSVEERNTSSVSVENTSTNDCTRDDKFQGLVSLEPSSSNSLEPSTSTSDSGICCSQKVNSNHHDSVEQNIKTLIPVIRKDQLLFSKTILGCGVQGKVMAGSWLGTDVAIKSIRIASKGAQRELAIREVGVHAQIRHPNIVQIMGYTYCTNVVHVVMELVTGDTLHNILFEDNVKEMFQLDDKKKTLIALQVCQAVNYLHEQNIPIIHRDLKPSNILVTSTLVAKICDLGLSKLYNLGNITRTNVGGFAKGTPMYMAPELCLNKQEATIKCDIWSLACTLIELYSECDVWDLDENQEDDFSTVLKTKMINLELPDLTKVPDSKKLFQNVCLMNLVKDQMPTVC